MTDGLDDEAKHRVAGMYERHASSIAAYALRRSSNTDAADIVAETFLVAWRRRDVVPEEPNTLPWLCGVARRVLANQRRSERRRGRLNDRLKAEFTRHTGSSPFEDTEEFRRVARALNKLSEHDAELLRLIAWEGLTPSEVAVAMDLAPGTARQRISRARRRLQRQLDRDGYATEIHDSALSERIDVGVSTRRASPQGKLLYVNTGEGSTP